MCGICGVSGGQPAALVESMLEAIRHRGPDSFDTFVSDSVSLGGCRLAIVRSAPASLPVSDEQTQAQILLNGEIYNYRELAQELGLQGVEKHPDPESRVVLELLRQRGIDGLSSLKGMFAMAIAKQGSTLLARDRLGIKPLFYAVLPGGDVAFSSEMKALLVEPRLSIDLDEAALEEIAVFGYINSPDRTPFRSIRQVPPGHVVEIRDNVVSVLQYPARARQADTHAGSRDAPPSSDEVFSALQGSVETMLAHDGCRKGFYLSGGLDSSVLVALAGQVADAPPITFTLTDREDSADFMAARRVADALGTEHHEFHVGLSDFLSELPHFIRHYECPLLGDGVFGAYGGMAFHMLSRRVAQHVRVGFSGEGADELFGGYHWPCTHPLGFADGLRARSRHLGSPDAIEAELDARFPHPEDETTYRRGALDLLMEGGLTNLHLWSVDRSCSAFGFEVRPPYLYDDVVGLALSLPVSAKATRTETKKILRSAAAPLLEKHGLSAQLTREKTGMPAAIDGIATEFRDYAARVVPPAHLAKHPQARYVRTPADVVMFDLFQLIFLRNRGAIPADVTVGGLYESGAYADLYN